MTEIIKYGGSLLLGARHATLFGSSPSDAEIQRCRQPGPGVGWGKRGGARIERGERKSGNHRVGGGDGHSKHLPQALGCRRLSGPSGRESVDSAMRPHGWLAPIFSRYAPAQRSCKARVYSTWAGGSVVATSLVCCIPERCKSHSQSCMHIIAPDLEQHVQSANWDKGPERIAHTCLGFFLYSHWSEIVSARNSDCAQRTRKTRAQIPRGAGPAQNINTAGLAGM